jgi:hypothetical protein
MTTESITIDVAPEAARAFREAPPDERKKLELMLSLRLRELTSGNTRSLTEIMDEMGAYAAQRGLTEAELNRLLNDE